MPEIDRARVTLDIEREPEDVKATVEIVGGLHDGRVHAFVLLPEERKYVMHGLSMMLRRWRDARPA